MLLKAKIAGLMTALMVLSVPMVYADNGPGDKDAGWHQDGGWHHGDNDHMMAKILGLSETQVNQLKDLHKQQRETMKGAFEQIKANREAFDAQIVMATPDMNKITDLQNQLKTLTAQMVDNHLSSILAVKKILTPEQFAGYMALQKEKRMKMRMMGHKKLGHKPGCDKDGHQWGHDQD